MAARNLSASSSPMTAPVQITCSSSLARPQTCLALTNNSVALKKSILQPNLLQCAVPLKKYVVPGGAARVVVRDSECKSDYKIVSTAVGREGASVIYCCQLMIPWVRPSVEPAKQRSLSHTCSSEEDAKEICCELTSILQRDKNL